ncbi:MAG: hypothetical protein C5B52_00965 [Bacteroidetes bacterium]|nr:MAG: hypothetical protein C5B52_00965 [Bacteroidota bacterium]
MSDQNSAINTNFHLERMILFSDAVFAIAITLLVIDIRVPELHDHITDKAILASLAPLVLKFIGFILSFFLIALFWTVHHRIFTFVETYTPRLLWLNLLYLFSIILMPFSSSLYGEYFGDIQFLVPYTVYVLNICLIGVTNFMLLRYIGNPKNNIANKALTPEILRVGMLRTVISPAVFFISLLFTFLTPANIWFAIIARFFPVFIPLAMRLSRLGAKKLPATER